MQLIHLSTYLQKLSGSIRELNMAVRLLTEVSSSPGTVALASFLVAFSERDAFFFPQLAVRSTTEHLVQQMGSALYLEQSPVSAISAFSTSA